MKYSLSGTMNLSWPEVLDAARSAEDMGFEEYYSSDHLMSVAGFNDELGILDAIALLPALVAATKRIRLGSLGSPITFRTPAVLLRQLHTLDVISAGRSIIGVGAGWSATEHEAFGLPFPGVKDRLAGLEAACRMMRERWPKERPVAPRAAPHILVAGASTAAITTAARHADAWNGMGSVGLVASKVAALRAAEKAVGRTLPAPVEATLNLIAMFSEDKGLLEATRKRMADPGSNRVQASMTLPGEDPTAGVYIGSPDGLKDRLAEYEAVGIQRVMLTTPRPFTRAALERLARAAGM